LHLEKGQLVENMASAAPGSAFHEGKPGHDGGSAIKAVRERPSGYPSRG